MTRNLVVAALCIAATSAVAVDNFTETFSVDAANWRYSDGTTPMTWYPDGGPEGDGDAYVSITNASFAAVNEGGYALIARAYSSYNSSGGAFVGNWITSGVRTFSIDVRHHLDVPAKIGVRLANPANNPGASILPGITLQPGEWGKIVFPITPQMAGVDTLSFGSGNYTSVFSSIGIIQFLLVAPPGYGHTTNTYTVDIDNPSIQVKEAVPVGVVSNAATYDRWMYPFGPPNGNRASASTFRTIAPEFDERDAQVYFAFVLTNEIPAGLGANTYEILSARFVATVESTTDDVFYDETPDSWVSFLDPEAELYVEDEDPGHPVELFGAGWRFGYTPWTFKDNGPFSTIPYNGVTLPARGIRTVYPISFIDGEPVDVSNNIDPDWTGINGFDAVPFAIGKADLSQGSAIPDDTAFAFDINVGDPNIQAYLAKSLDDGILSLVLTSLYLTSQEEQVGYPNWYQNEHLGNKPATLELTYRIKPSIALGLSGEARVARWSPAAAGSSMLEVATNLTNSAQWMPLVHLVQTNASEEVEALLPDAGSGAWFFRLNQN